MSDREIYNLRQDIQMLRAELDAVKLRLRDLERERSQISMSQPNCPNEDMCEICYKRGCPDRGNEPEMSWIE